MRVLDRKVLRDLWRMKLNVAAVSLVLGCGVAIFIMAVGMRETLEQARLRYYAQRNMADIAVSLVRAPISLARPLSALPGVAAIEARITGYATLDIPNVVEPAAATLVSLPEERRPIVNDLVIARGRWPDSSAENEVLVNQAFAQARMLAPGDEISATLNGRRQPLRVVGVANSPEFIFIPAPGEIFPQPERFAVIWIGERALRSAYDMDGAFNNLAVRLRLGADVERSINAIDGLLAPYGGSGANSRDRMVSDRYLTEELKQLATMAAFLPTFFLGIAAFLVNVALSRLVASERSNIGLMKAFGYSDAAVAAHYAKSAAVVTLIAAVIGTAAGYWLGDLMAGRYRDYYHFPELTFFASPMVLGSAWGAAFLAAALGAGWAVWRATRLAPAAALAPPPPASFASVSTDASWAKRLDAKSRIIARRIIRFPRRAATTVLGVALALSILIIAQTFPASMTYILDVNFAEANRQDATLSFLQPRQAGVLHDVERLPGVIAVEPVRADDVVMRHGSHSVHDAIVGVGADAKLSRMFNASGEPILPPPEGIVLSAYLAGKLGAHTGDEIEVEQTARGQIRAPVKVAAITRPLVGSGAFMNLDALSRLMREPGQITGAQVRLDTADYVRFNGKLKEMPALAGASFSRLTEAGQRARVAEGVGFMNLVYLTFAAVMAGGVAFSAARLTFAEQERDLATLRVLGFTRLEVSYVLVGELMVLALLAVLPGLLLGLGFAVWLTSLFSTEMFAFPFIPNTPGYAFALVFTVGCVLLAALVVRFNVDRLDMVGVLKARD